MSFLTAAALLVALLVGAPVAAHMLRRRRAEERPFPPARLVPATPPTARRRSMLEDRALFSIRVLAVLALAVLGATPLLRCSRLTLSRKAGASVALAIVIDDSLSMRAPVGKSGGDAAGPSRFDRAIEGARELTAGLHQGDAAAIVLAGAPPRVVLASTTNTSAIGAAIDGIEPSDRGTDLDGAIRLAQDLLKGMVHADKRVVVLSDLADGSPSAPALGSGTDIQLWAPLPDLEGPLPDCAVVRADRSGRKVHARVACTPVSGAGAAGAVSGAAPAAPSAPSAEDKDAGANTEDAGAAGSPPGEPPASASATASASEGATASASAGRSLEVRAGATVIRSMPLGPAVRADTVSFDLPPDAPEVLHVALTGSDAIAADDAAPVIAAGGPLPIAVVVDAASTHVATGGPPPIEQAFAALELDAQVRPLPSVPEHEADLNAYAGLIIDDAPGFTPEVRRSLAAWASRGGVALVTLGTRAASAPLGASFEPLIPGVVRWGTSPSPGIDKASAAYFGPSATGFVDLSPRGRASLDAEATEGADLLARWADGAPFLLRRSLGRGAVLALTLPLSTDESDLALRPAFLALLDRFASTTRARGGSRRIDAGETWTFEGFKDVVVERVSFQGPGSRARVAVKDEAPSERLSGSSTASDRRLRASPAVAGLYELVLDGERSTRAVSVPEREIDLRPRKVRSSARTETLGGVSAAVDVSPYVALALLALLAAELLVRTTGARKNEGAEGAAGAAPNA
jgi:hypothetical protein